MYSDQQDSPLISVVIPVYNEASTIQTVVQKVIRLPLKVEVVAVDDGSQDGTAEVLQRMSQEEPRLKVIQHGRNRGKTAALKTGFAATAGEIVIVQDADLEYDPDEIPSVVDPIVANQADVVYGSRFLVKKASRVLYFYHYLANKTLTFICNLFTNLNMTDVETGYKAFRGEIIRHMVIESTGFGFEIEVTAKVAKLNCRVFEVPISYYGRTYSEGKKIGMQDGFFALFYIFYFNLFKSRRASFRNLPINIEKQAEPGLRW